MTDRGKVYVYWFDANCAIILSRFLTLVQDVVSIVKVWLKMAGTVGLRHAMSALVKVPNALVTFIFMSI